MHVYSFAWKKGRNFSCFNNKRFFLFFSFPDLDPSSSLFCKKMKQKMLLNDFRWKWEITEFLSFINILFNNNLWMMNVRVSLNELEKKEDISKSFWRTKKNSFIFLYMLPAAFIIMTGEQKKMLISFHFIIIASNCSIKRYYLIYNGEQKHEQGGVCEGEPYP